MPTIKDVIVKKPSAGEAETARTWPIWGCDISQFDWEYTQTEKCLIISGQVTVYDDPDTGDSITIKPGDYVIFPADLKCVWDVTAPLEKYYDFE